MGVNMVRTHLEGGAPARLNVDAALASGTVVGHDTTGLANGRKTVTTAGTDVVLAVSTAAKWAIITAETDNTDIIVVGATGVDATLATRTGVPLFPGDSVTILCDNLDDIFIDSLVNGEGVSFTHGT